MELQQPKRGEIYATEAYALGKMLDHSSWNLPRKITPSDIDMVFDNQGDMLAVELSSQSREWKDIPIGQRFVYQRFVYHGMARNLAALAHHTVTPQDGRKIDTRNDVDSFQLMVYREGELWLSVVRFDWAAFVENEFYGSRKAFSAFGETKL